MSTRRIEADHFARRFHARLLEMGKRAMIEPWTDQRARAFRAEATAIARSLAQEDGLYEETADAVVAYALLALTLDGVPFLKVEAEGIEALRPSDRVVCFHERSVQRPDGQIVCMGCGLVALR